MKGTLAAVHSSAEAFQTIKAACHTLMSCLFCEFKEYMFGCNL